MKKELSINARFYVLLFVLTNLVWFGFSNQFVEAQTEKKDTSASTAQTVPHNKYALLVGISKYNRGNKEQDADWWNLNTKGDIEVIADVLIRKFEYKPENIKILSDEAITLDGKIIPPVVPTHKLIVDTFRSAITGKAQTGDIVYFHFSGHGQSIPDDNADETDGMDESIVPRDYVSQKDGSKNIRDDEIAVLLDELSRCLLYTSPSPRDS